MTFSSKGILSLFSIKTLNIPNTFNTNISKKFARKIFSSHLNDKNILFKRKLLTQPTPSSYLYPRHLSTEASLIDSSKSDQSAGILI